MSYEEEDTCMSYEEDLQGGIDTIRHSIEFIQRRRHSASRLKCRLRDPQ
jgi:hypothetical protein